MEALRFVRGLPAIPIAAAGRRRLPPAAHAAAVGPAAVKGNWVMNILRVGSIWEKEKEKVAGEDLGANGCFDCEECVAFGGGDEREREEEEERESERDTEKIEFDRDSFSRLLRRVSMVEMEVFAKLSYLGSLAYTIPRIKPANLLKYHGLRFVTSSLEKKVKSSNNTNAENWECSHKTEDSEKQNEDAYNIAASAASFLQSRGESEDESKISCSEMASFVATTNSVTAVVAGKEEMKQAVAEDLNSAQSSPCKWFICDDDKTGTRYFVIQGSESLGSWQANLLFEPIQFEGLDALVHRGIYEAAKGIYDQMLQDIRAHLESRGDSATLRFTGHSLGGSLALLVNLMLLIRGEAPSSALLPVITFGAPTIMCGGDYLLRKLGLPQSHVQAITMHRDIVPRAFSCNYPDQIANILRAVNGNFRNHPCLQNQKLLYALMGKLLILQPEEKFSPHHHLLPPGSGLYLLEHPLSDSDESTKSLFAAKSTFLNSPHPLEILSDRSAYGSDGTVYRNHDMNAYLRSIHRLMRKSKWEYRRLLWSPLVSVPIGTDAIIGQRASLANRRQRQFSFLGVFNGGKETLKRIGRIAALRNVQMFIVFVVPARLLVIRTLSVFPH